MNVQTDVPLINVPLATTDGRANPIWFQFFVQLWRRTGGGQGSSPSDLSVSDIDIDPDTISSDLKSAIDELDEVNSLQHLEVGDVDLPKLDASVKDIDSYLQSTTSDDGISQQQISLLGKTVELSLILEEALDVFKKLRRAIDDLTMENLTPIDPIRSIAYQDASNVKINGGSIDGTSIGAATASSGKFTTISATGQITSTLATGTAPFSIASTTVVPNLNVSQLVGNTWAVPASIGSTTPNSGTFTTVSASRTISSTSTSDEYGIQHLGGLLSGGKQFSGLLAGYQAATNLSGGFGFVADPTTPTNSFFHLTPYGSTEGSKFKFDVLGNFSASAGFGCNGKTSQTAYSLGGAATDLASVITLANNLRTMSINNGIGA